MYKRDSFIERFWRHVDKRNENECWNWKGHLNHGGYGQIGIDNSIFRSNRASWIIHNGEIPEGMQVLHKCDNPSCVNPNHLYLGTDKENSRDKVSRGRQAHIGGELHYAAKLKAIDVLECKKLYSAGNITFTQLASIYGVHRGTISRAIKGERWKCLQNQI